MAWTSDDRAAARRAAIGGAFITLVVAVSAYRSGGAWEALWTAVACLVGVGLVLGAMHVARR